MSNNSISTKLNVAALLVLGSCGYALAENTANIYTTDYFTDLNPLTEPNYTSQWVAKLTAHQLYRARCLEQDGESLRFNVRMEAQCLSAKLSILNNSIRLKVPRRSKAYRCYFDPSLGRLSKVVIGAVKSTVENISQMRRNSYHGNRLRVVGNNQYPALFLGDPPNVSEEGKSFLNFPLLRAAKRADNSPVDATAPISPRRYRELNKLTFGVLKFERATDKQLDLGIRMNLSRYFPRGKSPARGRTITKLRVKHETLMKTIVGQAVQSRRSTDVANRAHVILNVSPFTIKAFGRSYQQTFAAKAAGPYFLGFNFKSTNVAKQDLFDTRDFRELLAFSVWDSQVMASKFAGLDSSSSGHGVWIGQSLTDALDSARVNRPSSLKLADDIQYFLKNNSKLIAIGLKVRFTLEAQRFLGPNDIARFVGRLNALWKCNPSNCEGQAAGERRQIYFIPTIQSSKSDTGRGADLIVDRLIHGGRFSKVVDFLTPRNSANITGIGPEQLDPGLLRNLQKDTVAARAELSKWLQSEYNVISLGTLAFRDLYLKKMVKPAADVYCSGQAVLMHPYGVLRWEIR